MRALIVMLLMVSVPVFSSARPIADFPVRHIAANTYVIHGPTEYPNERNQGFMNNPGFVVTRTGVVVVDPGSSVYTGKMVLRQLRKITNKPVTHVLNTHVHGDHWLGNQAFADAFPKAKIMAHPKMISQAKNGEDKRWLDLMVRMTKGATKGTRAIIPDKAVEDAYQFKTGGMTFRIYAPAKAHSGTDIMIHAVEESVVFGGDNILNGRIARMDDATFRGSINACNVAIKINAKHYVPGHGQTGNVEIVRKFKKYLATLYQQVGKFYEQGMSDFEMKPKVIARLKDFQNWSGFNVEVGRQINLAMLEIEAAMFE